MSEPIVVPLLDLRAQYRAIEDQVREALDRVVSSQQFILGPEVEGLEREIAAYCACSCAVGVSSGTDALLVAFMALSIGPGDEVITSPFSFFATAGSIVRVGARPVFVDIDPLSFNLDVSLVAQAITPRTKAIVPVHLFGQMVEMDPVVEVASERGLAIVEDAAQAIGAEYRGRRAGSVGHLGAFSFFPSKNLGGFGDGGMVTTNDHDLAEKVRILRNHGASPKYYHRLVGGNFRLDAIQAAVLRVKLRYLDGWTEARRTNARRYRELFTAAGLSDPGVGLEPTEEKPVVLPPELPHRRHIYNQFVVRVLRRDELVGFLKASGIGCEVYYPVPLHQQECFRSLGYAQGSLPHSERAAAQVLALPIYPELSAQMQERVVEVVARFYGRR